ncbi:hypothetical protein OV079_21960 [Nannocystis pusilla]|uniref:Uncharacterized protein n=1 Tax=Nannocystis pusilla TaxID=889268 RepID=A0A9X3IZP8_9BACT|nr:hypothetical protein [Nannocystis pusilla]MCY1008173.1 hypothetical protein [Nannocystis pusilla]
MDIHGLPAQQIEQQVTLFSEQSLAGNVADIQSIQSDSFDGVSVIRLFLQPDADVASAMAQATAVSQTIVRRMPPGIVPPIILRYTASSVPIHSWRSRATRCRRPRSTITSISA